MMDQKTVLTDLAGSASAMAAQLRVALDAVTAIQERALLCAENGLGREDQEHLSRMRGFLLTSVDIAVRHKSNVTNLVSDAHTAAVADEYQQRRQQS